MIRISEIGNSLHDTNMRAVGNKVAVSNRDKAYSQGRSKKVTSGILNICHPFHKEKITVNWIKSTLPLTGAPFFMVTNHKQLKGMS